MCVCVCLCREEAQLSSEIEIDHHRRQFSLSHVTADKINLQTNIWQIAEKERKKGSNLPPQRIYIDIQSAAENTSHFC